jgi:hypothetical protein
MASQKQISANRKNARKSTGPKTQTGLARSSQNALRHGLSLPLPDNGPTSALRKGLAKALGLAEQDAGFRELSDGLLEISRVRAEKARAIDELLKAAARADPRGDPRSIASLERYERLARQKRRRGSRLLKSTVGVSMRPDTKD